MKSFIFDEILQDQKAVLFFMKKLIAILSLLFSIHGIFGLFFVYLFSFESITESVHLFLFSPAPYHFNGLMIRLILEQTEISSSSTSLSLLDLFLYLSFFVGALIYIFSKFRETRLLTFNYGLMVLASTIRVIYIIANLKDHSGDLHIRIAYLLLFIGYILMAAFFIKQLNNLELNTYSEVSTDTEQNYLEAASKSKRFLNFVIDNAIAVTLAYSFIKSAGRDEFLASFFRGLEAVFGEQFGGIIYFMTFRITYYLIFESLFQATPAKFLTRCVVTDDEGNKVSFKFILIRTLCRFIPFESILFLFGLRLHDTYSYSNVINQKKYNNANRNYLIFLGIGFFSILVIYFYKTF